ncbi:Ig-like domain-containing protein [Lysinibacter sp. HNR]|uniref:Ig-like domain-containing protein n=1 Tax=Lysinibacter sp. HNR TaxID=3031408 RepID=UPI002435F81B|nr:Ig-like domain-containing protein [Lysinibacter sp. HNR]WGD37734.1 Ig-like domain-containing protein [Lysinibacter sp. HNR]
MTIDHKDRVRVRGKSSLRALALAAIGAVFASGLVIGTGGSDAEAVDWQNDPTVSPRYEVVDVLGANERVAYGTAEMRADFVVRVPRGERPTGVRYNLYLEKGGTQVSTVLTPVTNIQAVVGQNYQVVGSRVVGSDEFLAISARGDSITQEYRADAIKVQAFYLNFPSGVISFHYKVNSMTRYGNGGRPHALNVWDYTTKHRFGYVGPNSQTGWGNVTTSPTQTLHGGLFSIDALTSGRTAAAGCDITDSLYYQFVRGDNGKPASVTPEPRHLSITSHASGVIGETLAAHLGQFQLDDPGYYKLLVWPQARSSRSPFVGCEGISWNPADPAQGTQVGSVFWQYDFGASTVAPKESSFAVTTGTRLANGTDAHQATVTLRNSSGQPIAGKTVDFSASDPARVSVPATAVTNANGQAQVNVTSREPGTYNIKASVAGVTIGNAAGLPVSFIADGPRIDFTQTALRTTAGNRVPDGVDFHRVTVTVIDQNGAPIPGVDVAFAAVGDPVSLNTTTARSNANGVAAVRVTSTADATARISATIGGVPVTQPSPTVTVSFARVIDFNATRLSVTKDFALSDGIDSQTINVQVLDTSGNPMPGVEVQFTGQAGLRPVSGRIITDVNGDADWLVTARTPGDYEVRATINGTAVRVTGGTGTVGIATFLERDPRSN